MFLSCHCVVELIEAGFEPVVVDNFSNAVRGEDLWRWQSMNPTGFSNGKAN
uniref:Uncharacterized protein n=1 Tax=Knipowitschia caucasica TaxID=637954 RepID=A0AAV2JFW0_KNICA